MKMSKLERLCWFCLLICAAPRLNSTESTSLENKNQNTNTTKNRVLITSEDQCETQKYNSVDVESNLEYRVQMKLFNSSCATNPNKKGFNCKLTFYQKDSLSLVGSKLCIDLQGVSQTLPDTQLTVTVFNQLQQELKEIYVTSMLFPDGNPFYVCSDESKSTLSVSLSVRESVNMCPYIMNKIIGHNISFGSVMMRPILPAYTLSMENCYSAITINENAYIVKVTSEGYSSSCSLRNIPNNLYSKTNSCIELMYVSLGYKCDISVELSQSSESIIKFDVPLGKSFPALKGQLFCKLYSGLCDYNLIIYRNAQTPCIGNFAIRATFTESDFIDNTDDTYVDDMRHMYMAVFISLISLCLLILCVTCIFCLRMRSKRLRTQRRELESVPSQNVGYEASHICLNQQGVSWNSNNPSEILGLPTYDDIFGKTGDDMVAYQTDDQKPPAYDSLFTSSV